MSLNFSFSCKKRFFLGFFVFIFILSVIFLYAVPVSGAVDNTTVRRTTEFSWRGAASHGDISTQGFNMPTVFDFNTDYEGVNFSSSWGAGSKRLTYGNIGEFSTVFEINGIKEGTQFFTYIMRSDSFSTYPTLGEATIGKMLFFKFFRGKEGFSINGTKTSPDKLYFNVGNGGMIDPLPAHKKHVNYDENLYNILSEPYVIEYSEGIRIKLNCKLNIGNNYVITLSVGDGQAIEVGSLSFNDLMKIYYMSDTDLLDMKTEMGLGAYNSSSNFEKTNITVYSFDDPLSFAYKEKVRKVYDSFERVKKVYNNEIQISDIDSFLQFIEDFNLVKSDESELSSADKYWLEKELENFEDLDVKNIYCNVIDDTLTYVQEIIDDGNITTDIFNSTISDLDAINLKLYFEKEQILSPDDVEVYSQKIIDKEKQLLEQASMLENVSKDRIISKINEYEKYIEDNLVGKSLNLNGSEFEEAENLKSKIIIAGVDEQAEKSVKLLLQSAENKYVLALEDFFSVRINEYKQFSDKQLMDGVNVNAIYELNDLCKSLKLANSEQLSEINLLVEKTDGNHLVDFYLADADYNHKDVPISDKDYLKQTENGIEFRLKRSDIGHGRLCYREKIDLNKFSIELQILKHAMISDYYPVEDGQQPSYRNKIEYYINFAENEGGYIYKSDYLSSGIYDYKGLTIGLIPNVAGDYTVNLYKDNKLLTSKNMVRKDTPEAIKISTEINGNTLSIRVNEIFFEVSETEADVENIKYLSIGNSMNSRQVGSAFNITSINGIDLKFKEQTKPVQPNNPEKMPTLIVVIICVASVVVIAGTACTVIIIKRRKR